MILAEVQIRTVEDVGITLKDISHQAHLIKIFKSMDKNRHQEDNQKETKGVQEGKQNRNQNRQRQIQET